MKMRGRLKVVYKPITAAFLLFISLFFWYCTRLEPEKILFDFKSDSDLDQFSWECHTLFSLSNEHATHGKKSLKLELFPSDYPGLAPKLAVNDWQDFSTFSFDVYNPQNREVSLTVRIDDKKDYPDYPDRYNKSFRLRQGANTIIIPIHELETSGTKRRLNLDNIYKVIMFMAQPKEKAVLFFDNFRLTR